MANLLVRNIDDVLVSQLKARAGAHGISAEEEHRRILQAALTQPKQRSFVEALRQIPNVGEDMDFERIQSIEAKDVFT
jgi:plasmid stability protein